MGCLTGSWYGWPQIVCLGCGWEQVFEQGQTCLACFSPLPPISITTYSHHCTSTTTISGHATHAVYALSNCFKNLLLHVHYIFAEHYPTNITHLVSFSTTSCELISKFALDDVSALSTYPFSTNLRRSSFFTLH